ncbi:hypothetical protein MD484_g2212, partial [Candolleomyces efflorescens]
MSSIYNTLNFDSEVRDNGSYPSLHSAERSPLVKGRGGSASATPYAKRYECSDGYEPQQPAIRISSLNALSVDFGFKKYCATLGIIRSLQDTTDSGLSGLSDHEDGESVVDPDGYQADVEDFCSDDGLSSYGEDDFDDTFNGGIYYPEGDNQVEDCSTAMPEVGTRIESSEASDHWQFDVPGDAGDQIIHTVDHSVGDGIFNCELTHRRSDFVHGELPPSSLREALIPADLTEASIPALFAMRRYPTLFVAIKGLPASDYKYYLNHCAWDFKHVAKEDPHTFLRIAVPYLGIANGLADPFTLFMEWFWDWEARQLRANCVKKGPGSEKDFEVRLRRAWANAQRHTARCGGHDWTKVSYFIELEFHERYPLSELLTDEMQSVIYDTLMDLRENGDPYSESLYKYWYSVWEHNFPWDLERDSKGFQCVDRQHFSYTF